MKSSEVDFEFDVGDFTYGHPEVRSYNAGKKLSIGKFCSISDNVKIFLGGNHRVDWITTYPFTAFRSVLPGVVPVEGHPSTKGNVTIGNDVWLASHCTILSGVTVGDGAVVGAHALVTKNVPPYAIVGGNPATILGYRFLQCEIEKLLEVKWWNLSINQILRLTSDLLASDVDTFLRNINIIKQTEEEERLFKARIELARLENEISAIELKLMIARHNDPNALQINHENIYLEFVE